MGLGFADRIDQQVAVVIEGHPLRQVEAPGSRDKRHLQLAAPGFICALLDDRIRGLRDGRFRLDVFAGGDGGDLLAFDRLVGDRTPGRQHVVNHVDGGGVAQQAGAGGDGAVGIIFQFVQALAEDGAHVGPGQAVDHAADHLLANPGGEAPQGHSCPRSGSQSPLYPAA